MTIPPAGRDIGSDEIIQVDVRIAAATTRDLETEVAEGRVREDLFYRLTVMPLSVPPLRKRLDDIPSIQLRRPPKRASMAWKSIFVLMATSGERVITAIYL
jgi:transcriptional regulator with GAF, ATPase, and Fis domain